MINKRRQERISTALPVHLGGGSGTTCDVSASGVFIETSGSFSLGESVDFAVELNLPAGRMMLKCRGEIVRTEQREGRVGLAIRISESSIGRMPLNGHDVVSKES